MFILSTSKQLFILKLYFIKYQSYAEVIIKHNIKTQILISPHLLNNKQNYSASAIL